MRNTKTTRVYDYWLALKGTRQAPARQDVSPRDLKGLLPFVFLAERMDADVTVFRLAGTGLCERYGRELRDHNLDALWSPGDRPAFRRFVDRVLETPAPGLAAFRAETVDRRSVSGEMLLLPLSDRDGGLTRLMGCAFATQSLNWLGQRPLVHQYLEGTRLIGDAGAPHERPGLLAAVGQDAASEDTPIATGVVRQRGHLKLVVSHDTPPAQARGPAPNRSLG